MIDKSAWIFFSLSIQTHRLLNENGIKSGNKTIQGLFCVQTVRCVRQGFLYFSSFAFTVHYGYIHVFVFVKLQQPFPFTVLLHKVFHID